MWGNFEKRCSEGVFTDSVSGLYGKRMYKEQTNKQTSRNTLFVTDVREGNMDNNRRRDLQEHAFIDVSCFETIP
jgi:hypothetical protein